MSIKKNQVWLTLSAALLMPLIYNNCMSQPDFDSQVKSLLNETVPLIHVKELKEKLGKEEIILLDTRSQEEFEVSHIYGALYVGYDHFTEEQVAKLDKDKPVVVYCSVGYRSEKIGEKLQDMGFNQVYNLYGGIFGWKNEHNQVVNSTGGGTDSVHTYNKKWSKWLKNGVKVY